ncbi:site-specific DNA-methyltransferase [Salinarimonas soli]|uniref:Methyltransferase n=1 Tax=Salinarimonas soli TaxID=1638099 RepID=A0A5B2V927_9HYPH|nr:site-specific DNA-methyltransferase [Salinarimonas soli]KAA2234737.1 site-specific DNA-methyltransferase [Salinarimonas soli]
MSARVEAPDHSTKSAHERGSAGAQAGATDPLAISYRALDSLIPYARNARTHSDAQVAQIAASIREFGWTNPILVDGTNGVIAGHGRLLAARKLGLSMVPVIELASLSEAQKRAYVLADNKLALNAGWDEKVLALEVADLVALGVNVDLTGFDAVDLDRILGREHGGLTDPDEPPSPAAQPVSRAGDMWLLGVHRLVCGDATDPEAVSRALNGVVPHLMVTDPPYGVSYQPGWRNEVIRTDGSRVAARATGEVMNDDRADWREAWALFPGEVAYVWHGALHAPVVAGSLEAAGFAIRAQIIWDKTRLVIGRGDYHWQHEPCWYAVRRSGKGHWSGDRKQTTVWAIPHLKSETGHGTQKPVACMLRPIENNSSPGQAVYEPFCGSGTTLIAAQMSGRVCHAIELDPVYVDVAVRRWQAFTGDAAVLEGTGQSFAEVEAERLGGAEAAV